MFSAVNNRVLPGTVVSSVFPPHPSRDSMLFDAMQTDGEEDRDPEHVRVCTNMVGVAAYAPAMQM